ncbi:hypothetical protein [Rhizomonospora bruguierae]|uniref:hypothetical protein n=1 Tax=Rhizomonospora bruguierae TaxID=1581705 RepID=UPI001BCAD632|nr:hypothetical protein [Micromonospora sp. NBRC 107566]
MTVWFKDAWGPGYGTSFEVPDEPAPAGEGGAEVVVNVERELPVWEALSPAPGARTPDVVMLVDGVRRIDGGMWSREPDGASHRALAVSYAAGVVRCDLRRGVADLVDSEVRRGLFTSSPTATDLVAGQVRYEVHRVGSPDPAKLPRAIQAPLTALEVHVSDRAGDDAGLLVLDGPLRSRRHLRNAVGYTKTQQESYLPAELIPVVTDLAPGQRTPVFRRGTRWASYSWYLRLPGPRGAPWSGIVRVECSTEVGDQAAIELADVSAVTLPRFASTPYKDARAPQNLVPIGGLERRLRALLGDPRLLDRALSLATRSPAPVTA